MEEIKQTKPQTIKQAINECYPFLNDIQIATLLKNKDIKVNGTRTKENLQLKENDFIQIYFDFDAFLNKQIKIIYEDENILIVNKFQGIEVVDNENTNKLTLEKFLLKTRPYIRAVHRLDLNTKGLVIFAKNEMSYNELYNAIKAREITKIYDAICYSEAPITEQTFCDNLETDKAKGISKITSKNANKSNKTTPQNKITLKAGEKTEKLDKTSEKTAILQILKANKITAKNMEKVQETNLKVVERTNNFSTKNNAQINANKNKNEFNQIKSNKFGSQFDNQFSKQFNNKGSNQQNHQSNAYPLYHLSISLLTGRTHQIRAQLAHHKIYILGDGKYGDKMANRHHKKSKQLLQASTLKFNFAPSSPLFYLNSKTFSIPFDYNNDLK